MNRTEPLTPVLMLVPYFAPQSHAAMFRAHKLAKYLPEYGYRPVIVTTDTNYIYNDDPGLLAELPPEVEIHRARYIEPSLRGIRMALGGADRRFATLKSGMPTATVPAGPQGAAPQRFSPGRLVTNLIGDWPDRHWTWTGPAFRMASRLIVEQDIRLLYSSANPVSFLRAAIRLKRKHGCTWLFDSRDPLGYGRKHSAAGKIAGLQERAILQDAINRADHVSGLSRSYGQIFFDLYGLTEDRWSFIPTGLDESYLPGGGAPDRENFLLHVGEVMPNQSRHGFEVLEAVLAQGPGFDRLVFVGRREVNEPIIRRMTDGLPRLASRLDFLDHRPQAEVYGLARQARACLLLPGPLRYWWTNFAKMVDYIALGVPVIAHVPPISEAREELSRAGGTIFLGEDVDADARALSDWLGSGRTDTNSTYSPRYTARRQVADFAALFDRLLTTGRPT